MTVVVHETPGLLDMTALTVMALSAKPNSSSPIGRFGTGLKYAVAILVREKIPLTVWVGEEAYVFGSDPLLFREQEHQQLHYRRRTGATARWRRTVLPFTTALGQDWKVWMALRELHANTLDEGGRSYSVSDAPEGIAGKTRIVVEGEAYAQEFAALDEIFLPEYRQQAEATLRQTQMIDRPSRHAYWRGMRVGDLQKPAIYTWSVAEHMYLTEDRTLMHPWTYSTLVRNYVMQYAPERVVRRVLSAPETTFEGSLDYNGAAEIVPSEDFLPHARLAGRRTETVVLREDRRQIMADAAKRATWDQEVSLALRDDDLSAQSVGDTCRRHRKNILQLIESYREQRDAELMGSQSGDAS